jgi:hypothetical protein
LSGNVRITVAIMGVLDQMSCSWFVSRTYIVAGFEYLLGRETFEDL